ncbi:ASC1-like protein 1 isoform X2 [Elaeis guineensis]|uniref:ASC1-like protein 1 isoform X2 n=1 Tax=Elaeis guineensis var. tenera TaxID=51953 RepID=A0A6I9RKM2_ELAGV|nr:ASC1-like protein 1 isoform X2 [Elaeis guineensis]
MLDKEGIVFASQYRPSPIPSLLDRSNSFHPSSASIGVAFSRSRARWIWDWSKLCRPWIGSRSPTPPTRISSLCPSSCSSSLPSGSFLIDSCSRFKLKAVYMYAAGFYTYSIFALMLWETRRSDFGVSMSHHVASVVLIVLSYIFRFARVGSVVLAIHDASDVFLETGKMSKYSSCEWLASASFPLFVASWFILRLIYFPFWILRSTSYEVVLTLDKEKHKFEGPLYYYVFNTLLFSLLVLHIYWWVLMYRMLVKQIQSKGHVGDDVRSDSEGEEEHED